MHSMRTADQDGSRALRSIALGVLAVFGGRSGVAAPAVPFSARPAAADFGTAFVNTVGSQQVVTFLRTGADPLTVSRVAVGGEFQRDFSVDLESCTGDPLAADGGCFARVTFSPKGVGTRLASLQLFTTGIDAPLSVPLVGVGIATPVTVPAGGTQGVPALVDFEDLALNTAVSNQYDGVTFAGGGIGIVPSFAHIAAPPAGTISGKQVLEAVFPSAGAVGSHLVMRFDIPQRHVSLSTGLAFALRQPAPAGYAVVLQGFDSKWEAQPGGAAIVGQPIVTSATGCLGVGPTALDTPLEIMDPAGRIQYAVVSVVYCGRPPTGGWGPDNVNYGPTGVLVGLDNLGYDHPLHPPVRPQVPLVVTSRDLVEGATITGVSPVTPSVPVTLDVQATSLQAARASINGGPPIALGFHRTGPTTFQVDGQLGATDGLRAGMNVVDLTATTADHPPVTMVSTVHFNYIYPIFQVEPTLDVVPTAFEVTQTIDAGPSPIGHANPNNDGYLEQAPQWPPLLRGKATMVRIYGAQWGGGAAAIKNVPALATVIDTATNTLVLGSFPPHQSLAQYNRTGITVWPAGSQQGLPTNPANFDDLTSTWDFLIPSGWTYHDLDVVVNINNGNYGHPPSGVPAQECTSGKPLKCAHNNRVVVHIHFQDAPSIYVEPVFIRVVGPWTDGKLYDLTPSKAQANAVFAQLNELYPEVVLRGATGHMTELTFQDSEGLLDDLGNNFDDNINDSSQMAIGLYPGGLGHFFAPNAMQPDGSVVVGTAYTGDRDAWADADNPVDIAHELGHNMGFDHFGCENGVTDDECGAFPIPHAGIGMTGTDIANWKIIPRGNDSSNGTPHAHDFMSYGQLCSLYGGASNCDLGEWVSWFTYQLLLDTGAQIGNFDTDDPPALLVRGVTDGDGHTTFKPVFQVLANRLVTDNFPPDDTGELQTLRGFDARGNLLFVHNFEPKKLEIHDPGVPVRRRIREPVPLVPNLARLALTSGLTTMGELTTPNVVGGAQVQVTSPKAGDQWPARSQQTVTWTVTGVPATAPAPPAQIQLSLDGGKTRRTVARDVTGGSFMLDTTDLPGGDGAVLYVQISDGLHQAEAVAGPFSIAPKAPDVEITSPAAGTQYDAGVPVSLDGTASDPQEKVADPSYQWSSDRDGALGAGMHLTTTTLTAGHHVLKLVATDSLGLTGQDSVEIDVVAPAPSVLRGDVNGDGKVDLRDAILALQSLVGLLKLTPPQTAAADFNGDGSVTLGDVVLILRVAVGLT